MKSVFAALIILFCGTANAFAQKKSRQVTVKAWVRDSLPPVSDTLTDIQRVDMIYLYVLKAKNYRKGRTLFACMRATLRHNYIPTLGLRIPLTLENTPSFRRRIKKLPGALFADNTGSRDSDKLQHFFASAWLAYFTNDPQFADLVGIAVERGEDLIVTSDIYDERDIRANRLGQQFAIQLRKNPHALPGDLFRAWNDDYNKNSTRTK